MKNILLISLFSLVFSFGNTIYSQKISDPIEITLKDGRIIILKPDGTWDFKIVNTKSSPVISTTENFNKLPDLLPANFKGHDPTLVFNELLSLKTRLIKNEFETTSEYEKRISEELKKPIAYGLGLDDTFAFVTYINVSYKQYDADRKVMSLYLQVGNGSSLSYKYKDKYRLYSFDWKDEGYRGDEYYIDSNKLLFNDLKNFPLTRKYNSEGFYKEVSLDIDEAKRIKDSVKAIFFLKFEEPFAENGPLKPRGLVDRQFQVRLVDIYFFDSQTGKVLAKMSEPSK